MSELTEDQQKFIDHFKLKYPTAVLHMGSGAGKSGCLIEAQFKCIKEQADTIQELIKACEIGMQYIPNSIGSGKITVNDILQKAKQLKGK